MINFEQPEIQFAIEAVRQAGKLSRQVQAEMVTQALTKDDRSPVTVADFGAQALVAQMLMTAFPDDPLVGEEDASVLQTPEEAERLKQITDFVGDYIPGATSEDVIEWINYGSTESGKRFWTLDPIDGTKGFLRKEQYAIALAMVVNGKVEIGVLGCPNLVNGSTEEIGGAGSLVVAQRGKGAWVTALYEEQGYTQLYISKRENPTEARFIRSFEAAHTNVSQLDIVGQKMGAEAEPVRLDSQAKYSMLAAGAGELYFRLLNPKQPNYKEKIWDQAAGSLVAEEAGGKVSDLDGKPLDFSQGRTLAENRGVLASNTRLHDAALKAIKEAGA